MCRAASFLGLRVLCLAFIVSNALTGCKDVSVPKSGEVAPAISCNDIAGEYFSLGQLKGKAVVIYFWSSRCCGDTLKTLEPFYQQHKYDGLSILAIEVGGPKEKIATFVHENGITFINLTDEQESLARSYRVIGFPTLFLIDKKGVIQTKVSGEIGVDQLNRLVTPLL